MAKEKITFEIEGTFGKDGRLITDNRVLNEKLSKHRLNVLDLIDPSICVLCPGKREGKDIIRVEFNLP